MPDRNEAPGSSEGATTLPSRGTLSPNGKESIDCLINSKGKNWIMLQKLFENVSCKLNG